MFNPAGTIYNQVDKRIRQGKIISEGKKNKNTNKKGMLVRSNKMQDNDNEQSYNEPMDFVVDAVITLRKEKEMMMEKLNGSS